MPKHFFSLIPVLALVVLSGCTDFDPGSLIADTRVLGARVEVHGDEARASPRPGEAVDITWVVAAPNGELELRWAFLACEGTQGDPSCVKGLSGVSEGHGSQPALSFALPKELKADQVLVLGVICDGGTPAVNDQGTPTCEGDSRKSMPVKLTVKVAHGDDGNRNPSLAGARLTLAGKIWEAATPAGIGDGSCKDDETLLKVKAGAKTQSIELSLEAASRETYPDARSGEEELETLQISHFATLGELDGQYSFVETDDESERPTVTFHWDPPAARTVSAEGELVRFVIVVRDLRGGLSSLRRALCVVH
jgi:hypothetical protein